MAKDKPLRFAALIRVSTEKQEKQGESLRTQEAQLSQAVEHLGGSITQRYAGQEHATVGYERKQVEQLLSDAQRKLFDAVIVADPTRWSRDNLKSETGLLRLRVAGIRFFVLSKESDLFNPQDRFMLSLSTSIGALHAGTQKQKSLENRIHRAERGRPTAGKLPFGRTYDKDKGWDIDEDKQAMIIDVATRYLNGAPLAKLAVEYNVNHSNLHKVLTQRCGDTWEQEFKSDDLNIHKVVSTPIPRLLPEKIIKAIRKQADANRTFQRGQFKHHYLFKSVIFCGHCGKTLGGQMNHGNRRYYRHSSRTTCKRKGTKAWVLADKIESVVIRELFECFGNPRAVQRAIEAAIPNRDKFDQMIERAKRLEGMLARTIQSKDKLIHFLANGKISDEEADKELTALRKKEAQYTAEINSIKEQLEGAPTPAAVKERSKQVSQTFRRYTDTKQTTNLQRLDSVFELMTWEDQRALVELIFGGKTGDGKRMGIYIYWSEGYSRRNKRWKYTIVGHLKNEAGYLTGLKRVTNSVWHSRGTAPPAPRSASPPPRPRA